MDAAEESQGKSPPPSLAKMGDASNSQKKMGARGRDRFASSELLWPQRSREILPRPELAPLTPQVSFTERGLWFLLQGPQCLHQAGKPSLVICPWQPGAG